MTLQRTSILRFTAIVALAMFLLASLPASAQTGYVGGCTFNCGPLTAQDPPGGTTTYVNCNSGQIKISPLASAQSSNSSQQIAYRYVLLSSSGYQFTSAWSGWTLAPSQTIRSGMTVFTPRTSLYPTSFAVAKGLTWFVYVQYVWYTPGIGTGFVYSYAQGPTYGYGLDGNVALYQTTCKT